MEELNKLIEHLIKRCEETQTTEINPNQDQFHNYYEQLRQAYSVRTSLRLLTNGIEF
jgi:hypothetical protein